MRRSTRLNKHQGEGTTKNKRKQKMKQVEVIDSSSNFTEYDPPINYNQSDSWECPPSARGHLIPDTVISSRRASLRSAKRLVAETPSLSRCSQPQESREDSFVQILRSKQAYESPTAAAEGAPESPSRCLREVANPSTLTPEMRHVGTENAVNSVYLEMERVHKAEKSMPHHSNQVEGTNTFEAECLPLGLPSAVDLQASNHVEKRANINHNRSISMARTPSLSLKLTEMVNMWGDEDGEVDSVRQHSPKDNDHGYQLQPEYMPMLRKLLSKHGDIAKNCTVGRIKYRSMLLELVFDIITELQENEFGRIKEDSLLEMIDLVSEMKDKNVDIGWLQGRLEEILEAKKILKQSGMLREKREGNKKAIENLEREIEECGAEKMAMAAKFRTICEREAACKEALITARDEGTRVHETISYAKAKVRCFLKCSMDDGLL